MAALASSSTRFGGAALHERNHEQPHTSRARRAVPSAALRDKLAFDRDWGTSKALRHKVGSLVQQEADAVDGGLTDIRFSVVYCGQPGEVVRVTGSAPQLGQWDPDAALPMEWTDDHAWVSRSVQLKAGSDVEYKFLILDERSEQIKMTWQPGRNCLLHIPEDGAGGRYSASNAWQASESVQLKDQQALPQEILTQCFECGACLLPHLHCHRCPLVYPDWQDVGLPGESFDGAAVVYQ